MTSYSGWNAIQVNLMAVYVPCAHRHWDPIGYMINRREEPAYMELSQPNIPIFSQPTDVTPHPLSTSVSTFQEL